MATFEGTREEFMRFLGSYFRIKVLFITRKYKQQVGKCEECNSTSKTLEAAHVRGKERPLLIKSILSNYGEGSTIKVDLKEFEELFVKAHEPLEKTIRILCTECHRKYDSLPPATMSIPETSNTVIENHKVDDDMAPKDAHNTTKPLSVDKPLALQMINKKTSSRLNNGNTIFSNINAAIDVWWLEPKNDKFNFELHFILNHPAKGKLYYFRIPAGAIKNPKSVFEQRGDKPCSRIYIPVSGFKFVDKKGFNFTPFLVTEISY